MCSLLSEMDAQSDVKKLKLNWLKCIQSKIKMASMQNGLNASEKKVKSDGKPLQCKIKVKMA